MEPGDSRLPLGLIKLLCRQMEAVVRSEAEYSQLLNKIHFFGVSISFVIFIVVYKLRSMTFALQFVMLV